MNFFRKNRTTKDCNFDVEPNEVTSSIAEVFVCPETKGKLIVSESGSQLICAESRLAYQIEDGVPVLLKNASKREK